MQNLVIADDDKLALEHLQNIIDWSEYNISFKGAFSSGNALLKYIETNHVDIVISDIKMSAPDGLEIARLCQQRFPYISVILISAFRNFEYAKTAIIYGVKTYILKPFTAEDVIDAINNIQRQSDYRANSFITPFMKNLVYQRLFSDIGCGLYENDNDILAAMYNAGISDGSGFVITFNINNLESYLSKCWKYGATRFFNALSNVACSIEEGMLFCLFIEKHAQFSVIALNVTEAAVISYIDKLTDTALSILQVQIQYVSKVQFSSVTKLEYILKDGSISADDRLQKINEYIAENYMHDLSLETIAKHFGFSKEYFCSLYKKLSGKTLTDSIQETRLNKACELLIYSDLKISQIVNAVGYKSQSYFTKQFAMRYEITPSEYREIYAASKK